MLRNAFFTLMGIFLCYTLQAQSLPDSCKLNIGTNLSGLADWGTEIPFVDLMKRSREWYTKSIGDPEYPFDSGFRNELNYRSDGYPTHIPQNIPESPYPQEVATIWAITDAWPAGNYTLLWEGEGDFDLWGGYSNLQQTGDHRLTFDFLNPVGGVIELKITASDINDPIHNIRLLMPGTEETYETQPFYQLWLDKVAPFKTIRFMDWGATNNWGQPDSYDWDNPGLFDWSDRSQMEHYTWTTSKGVPYEMMVKLLNDYDLDGWVCVPHRASDDYIRKMAEYFRDNLEPGRHLYVEYSNEIWNWIFGQAQWLLKYGCELQGVEWPEGTVPYIQNNLNIWTNVFENDLDRITRVVGTFTAWQDVSERICYNLDANTFDAVSPTYYFGLSEEADAALDGMGASAAAADIAGYVREHMPEGLAWIEGIKGIADELDKQLLFYEGGQHITPHPFGEEPTYAQALLDIQRDTAMYNLYNEWFDGIRNFQEGEEPLLLMNFAFVGGRSARYGSWGILETMDQNLSQVPAPKYQAILENMDTNCQGMPTSVLQADLGEDPGFQLFPNPAGYLVYLDFYGRKENGLMQIYNQSGRFLQQIKVEESTWDRVDIAEWPDGIYIFQFVKEDGQVISRKLVKMED